MRFDIGQASSSHIRRFTLYLPERDREGREVPQIERWVQLACTILAQINGGATHARADGVYLNESGLLIHEPLNIIYSIVDPERFYQKLLMLRAFIQRFGEEANQETVAVEFDNKLYVVPIAQQAQVQAA